MGQKPERIREFWNEKAKENAYWFVSSYGGYGSERSLEEFWKSGNYIWGQLKAALGYSPEPTHRVVEIGCGVGRMSRAMAPETGYIDAFDVSNEMLSIAGQANLPNVIFRLGNGSDLQPLPDACADLVLAYCVFQHLPSEQVLQGYLADMARVVKPGGMIAFSLAKRTWTYYLLPAFRVRAFLREKLSPGGPKGVYKKEWIGIRPSTDRVRRLCPIPLQYVDLFGDKWLFYGRRSVVAER